MASPEPAASGAALALGVVVTIVSVMSTQSINAFNTAHRGTASEWIEQKARASAAGPAQKLRRPSASEDRTEQAAAEAAALILVERLGRIGQRPCQHCDVVLRDIEHVHPVAGRIHADRNFLAAGHHVGG